MSQMTSRRDPPEAHAHRPRACRPHPACRRRVRIPEHSAQDRWSYGYEAGFHVDD